MKKRVTVIAAIVICLSLLAAGTIAYFTDEAVVHNVITTSGVDIEIQEWQEGEDGTLKPYPKDPIEGIMPSDEVSKIVTVYNDEAAAYVRARYEIVVKDADEKVMEVPAEELARVITIVSTGDAWQSKDPSDGWMYYTQALDTDTATEPLFTDVRFSGVDMGNEYQNCTFEVIVYAQGVQAANNGATALEAAGWSAD